MKIIKFSKTQKVTNNRLEELIIDKMIDTKNLSEKTNIPKREIFNYINGIEKPNARNLVLLSDELDVTVDYLLKLTNKKNLDKNIFARSYANPLSTGNAFLDKVEMAKLKILLAKHKF